MPASDLLEDCIVVQYVNQSPLPKQDPLPKGTHDWVMSFDLKLAWMKIRQIQENRPMDAWPTWWFKSMVGRPRIIGTDNSVGRIYLTGRAQLKGDTLYLNRPTSVPILNMVYPIVNHFEEACGLKIATDLDRRETIGVAHMPNTLLDKGSDSHFRLCYRRANEDWRIRDHTVPWGHPDALIFVYTYMGDLNGNWMDGGSYIFHDGPIYIDENEVAHFIDPSEPLSGLELPCGAVSEWLTY